MTVVRFYDTFYIDAVHYTKKHPSGVTLLFNDDRLNNHVGVSCIRYLFDIFNGGFFEFKREDGDEFDAIDRRLNRINKHEHYLWHPKSQKCVPSVMKQLSNEYEM